MSYVLTYKILNAQVATTEVEIDYDGQPATVTQKHALIEALPDDKAGKTLTLVLPAEAVADFEEGASLSITIETGDSE